MWISENNTLTLIPRKLADFQGIVANMAVKDLMEIVENIMMYEVTYKY